MQSYFSWAFYLPLAVIVPPKMFYIHRQINLLYQFWIHSKLIGKLGFLDKIFNTPSNHRVHHGRNPRYLDKNYGGILIIFDRLFGTYQEEDEEAVFGLVHPSQSFDLFYGQLGHFVYIYHRFKEVKGWKNKLAVLWKGPGWTEGTARLGDPATIPPINPHHRKYDPLLPRGFDYYIAINFLISVCFSVFLTLGYLALSPLHAIYALYVIFSLQTYSLLSDNRPHGYYLELIRTSTFLLVDLACYMLRPAQSYLILWYEADPTFGASLRASSLGFIFLRLSIFCSLWFVTLHIVAQYWLGPAEHSKGSVNVNHIIERPPTPVTDMDRLQLNRYSPVSSPTSQQGRSRKNRIPQADMAR